MMNKPPVNAINYEFLDEIKTTLTQLQNDKARGMIWTSVCIIVYHRHFGSPFILNYYTTIEVYRSVIIV